MLLAIFGPSKRKAEEEEKRLGREAMKRRVQGRIINESKVRRVSARECQGKRVTLAGCQELVFVPKLTHALPLSLKD